MALGWNDVQRMKRVETRANALGFAFKSGDYTWGNDGTNAIYVKPKDDLLPIYSRDASFFTGSIESIEGWLDGIEWARAYDTLLKVSNDKKRTDREQIVRNQHLMETIKTGNLVSGVVGSLNINDLQIQLAEEFGDGIPF